MPVEIVWSPLARARLQEIHAYVALENPAAAARLAIRIVSAVDALRNHPHMGRQGAKPGVRELVIGATPYIAVYHIRRNRITIDTIWHGAQQNEP